MRELALVVLSCCGDDWLMVQPATAAARVAATAAWTISFMRVVSPYVARVWHNALQRKGDLVLSFSKSGKSRQCRSLLRSLAKPGCQCCLLDRAVGDADHGVHHFRFVGFVTPAIHLEKDRSNRVRRALVSVMENI